MATTLDPETFTVGTVAITTNGLSINYGSADSPNSRGVIFSKDEMLTTDGIMSWAGQSIQFYKDGDAVVDVQIGDEAVVNGRMRLQRMKAMRPVNMAYATADKVYNPKKAPA